MKDLGRLLDGLSLVAKEVVKRSQPRNNHHSNDNTDLRSLISSSFKKAILSATDLTGLTSGKVREFNPPLNCNSQETSVVFFAIEQPPPPPQRPVQRDQAVAPQISSALPPSSTPPPTPSLTSDVGSYKEVLLPDIPSPSADGIKADSSLGSTNNGNGTSNNTPQPSGGDPENTAKDGLPTFEGTIAVANERVKEEAALTTTAKRQRRPRERRVPSTPFSRALGFAGLGAGLAWGTIQESAKRLVFGTPDSQDKQSALSPFLSERNAERLALALCRMRGAALKLGQMLSIQDESVIPPPILAALDVVRQGADVMPRSQLNQVLDAELGPDWSSKLISFDYEPLAAASIGQVHRAVTKDGLHAAVKIQYPGVADSIESDIENVKLLLQYTNLLPERLFLDRAMK
ncbi:hypothetical protein U1Q18_040865, partial [Sarracenia purpurea var. burkii]